MIKRLLVGYDGKEEANLALNFALDMAKTYQSTVHAIFVIRESDTPIEIKTEAQIENVKRQHHQLLDELNKRSKEAGIAVNMVIQIGSPEHQIIAEAEKIKADTIVVGHHSRNPLARWLVGSVTRSILDNAQCTVIVVKKDHHSNKGY